MAHPLDHAKSSAKQFGGDPKDFQALHKWFDQTKAHVADARHRMILHNSFGIFLCEQQFGDRLELSTGKTIATRLVAEQHVREDFGFIPSLEQCLDGMPLEKWMFQGAQALSRIDGKLKPKPEARDMYRLAKPGEASDVGFRQRQLDEFIAGRELAAALAPGATHLVIEAHSEYDDEGGYYDSMDGVEFYRGIERLYPFLGDEPREELLAAWDRLMALYGQDDKLGDDDEPLECLNNFLDDNNIFSEAFSPTNGVRIDLERAPEKPKELYG